MKKLIITLSILILPCLVSAEWSTPVWTDDCTITVQKDKDGKTTTWTEICRDEHGVQTSKRTNTYTYYESGEVDKIIQKRYENNKLTKNKEIKHWKDGHNPVVKDIQKEIP